MGDGQNEKTILAADVNPVTRLGCVVASTTFPLCWIPTAIIVTMTALMILPKANRGKN